MVTILDSPTWIGSGGTFIADTTQQAKEQYGPVYEGLVASFDPPGNQHSFPGHRPHGGRRGVGTSGKPSAGDREDPLVPRGVRSRPAIDQPPHHLAVRRATADLRAVLDRCHPGGAQGGPRPPSGPTRTPMVGGRHSPAGRSPTAPEPSRRFSQRGGPYAVRRRRPGRPQTMTCAATASRSRIPGRRSNRQLFSQRWEARWVMRWWPRSDSPLAWWTRCIRLRWRG